MESFDWENGVKFGITICDKIGTISYMNEKATETFSSDGGWDLIGKNLLDCHPEPARTRVEKILNDEKLNIYTIEKKGIKKLIYQTPYYEKGNYMGLIELSMEIPFDMPNFIRQD